MLVVRVFLVVALSIPAHADPARPAFTDTRCAQAPSVTGQGFRHKRSKAIAKAGSPNHRGIDLIASEADKKQVIAGKLAYGKLDKDIEDEDAEVFACIDERSESTGGGSPAGLAGRAGGGAPRGTDAKWKSLGVARTNDDGRFALALEDARLPVGMRDLYVAALGDATGAYFVGYVATQGTGLVVTDVDGTLSWSENSIIKTVISRDHDIKHRPNAPEALSKLAYPIVYTTARGDVFIDVTRKWLERHGFPRGLLRLSSGLFARPGAKAIAYKKAVLAALPVSIAAGIGNRKSDITAYTAVGVAAQRILIHLPEYEKEVRKDIDAGKAVGFADYTDVPQLVP